MKFKISSIIIIINIFILSACAESQLDNQKAPDAALTVATFAGGCFWCTESDFEKVTGVYRVISGFSGGHIENPSYELASTGSTGHVEAVQVFYDPKVVTYDNLLEFFWRQIDPTDSKGQFVDRGEHYRPVIFYHDADQQKLAESSKLQQQNSGRYKAPVTTEIVSYKNFYAAEEYHQDYYKKNPIRYKYYRFNSGRDQYLEATWGQELKYHPVSQQKYSKPADDILKTKLTALQYNVTQKEATERAFNNPYWDEKRSGIYVDIVSGEPLFSSTDKFKSGTGWPSFTKVLKTEYIVKKTDHYLIYPRTEIRSKYADSHLGHLFTDGPQPTGNRYCINSAALRFVPAEQLKAQGYEEFQSLFSITQ